MNLLTDSANQRRICPCCGTSKTEYRRRIGGWAVSQCEFCGSVFSQVVPSPQNISAIYNKLYSESGLFEQHRNEVSHIENYLASGRMIKVGWERKRFFRRCNPAHGSSLLDIGCGTGLFLVAASQMGWSVSGIEVSREAAELGQMVHNLPVRVGTIEEIELPDESFEVVTAWEVLEHIVEVHRFLRVILRILKPGGVFAGSVPNYGRPRYRSGDDLGPLSCPPIHVNFWNRDAFEFVLKHSGFANVEVSWPRCSLDLLKPLRQPSLRKVVRFAKTVIGVDVPTSMFFMCQKV